MLVAFHFFSRTIWHQIAVVGWDVDALYVAKGIAMSGNAVLGPDTVTWVVGPAPS